MTPEQHQRLIDALFDSANVIREDAIAAGEDELPVGVGVGCALIHLLVTLVDTDVLSRNMLVQIFKTVWDEQPATETKH